jgi:hypothetical protein
LVFGDGIRRNVATISKEERIIFRDAIINLDSEKFYPDNVSYWDKLDQIHQVNHIHAGPDFLPFHRNLLAKFEDLLREINPKLSLHYYDYMTDALKSPDGKGEFVNLFTSGEEGFMGNSSGEIGFPLDKLSNKGKPDGSREQTGLFKDPPMVITRDIGSKPIVNYPEEQLMIVADSRPEDRHYAIFSPDLAAITNQACEYIGGTIGGVEHKTFQDPCSLVIYSNTDRLWASWQQQKKYKEFRLNLEKIYGRLSNDSKIKENFEPFAGGSTDPSKKIPPWGIQWDIELKNCKSPDIVNPPIYDKYAGDVDL